MEGRQIQSQGGQQRKGLQDGHLLHCTLTLGGM